LLFVVQHFLIHVFRRGPNHISKNALGSTPIDLEFHITVYVSEDMEARNAQMFPAHLHYDGVIPHATYTGFRSSYVKNKNKMVKDVVDNCRGTEPLPLAPDWP